MALLDVVNEFFDDQGWSVQLVPDSSTLSLFYQGDNDRWWCLAHVLEEQRQFVFFSIYPFNVPPKKRPAVSEFLTRANYNLTIGNLEMDYEDGEVRFRTGIDVEDQELTVALTRSVVYINLLLTDRFYPSLSLLVNSDISPAEAIAIMQNDTPTISP